MARKRRPTREELERQAQIELERSMGRSMGPQGSPYSSPPGPAPAWESDAGPRRPEPAGPPAREQEPGSQGEDQDFSRPTAAEEEAAVTELALQQWAERRGGGSLETHVVNRMQPSQAEAARDQALREALARQQRFASPIRRAPVPQSKQRGFANSWTSSSPSAAHEEPMMWESAVPGGGSRRPVRSAEDVDEEPAQRPPRRKAPAKRASASRSAAPKKTAAKRVTKKATAKKATAKKATAKKATAKKASTTKKASAKKATAKKASTTKKATAKKASTTKRASATKKSAKKKAPATPASPPVRKAAPSRRSGTTSRRPRG